MGKRVGKKAQITLFGILAVFLVIVVTMMFALNVATKNPEALTSMVISEGDADALNNPVEEADEEDRIVTEAQQKKTNRLYTWIIVLLFVFIVSCFAYFEYMRFKHKLEAELRLKNYILDVITRGFSKHQIRDKLEKSGLPDKLISSVFKDLEKYNLKAMHETAVREKELHLKKYVFHMFNKNFSREHVRKDLKISNWPDKTIDHIFSEISVYFPSLKARRKHKRKRVKQKKQLPDYIKLSELSKPRGKKQAKKTKKSTSFDKLKKLKKK